MSAPDVRTLAGRAEIKRKAGLFSDNEDLIAALDMLDAAQARIAELERIGPRAG
jgi:hypothetical protein